MITHSRLNIICAGGGSSEYYKESRCNGLDFGLLIILYKSHPREVSRFLSLGENNHLRLIYYSH